MLGGLGLGVVGRLGLVGDEAVVGDHYRGGEDWGGHEDGVAVDLLHGEGRSDDLLLQRVSADERRSHSDVCTSTWVCVCACGCQKQGVPTCSERFPCCTGKAVRSRCWLEPESALAG